MQPTFPLSALLVSSPTMRRPWPAQRLSTVAAGQAHFPKARSLEHGAPSLSRCLLLGFLLLAPCSLLHASSSPTNLPIATNRTVAISTNGVLRSTLDAASWRSALGVLDTSGYRTNLTHLLSTTPTNAFESWTLLGRATPGDGGQGILYWDPASTAATNEAITFAAPTGRWQRLRGDGRINVQWWGATTNDNTDDTAAIQAAANYASNHAAILYFPAGRYDKTNTTDSLWFVCAVDADRSEHDNLTTGATIYYTGSTNIPHTIVKIGNTNYGYRLTGVKMRLPKIEVSQISFGEDIPAHTNIVAIWSIGLNQCEVWPWVTSAGIGLQVGGGPKHPTEDYALWPSYLNTYHIGQIQGCSWGIYATDGCNQNRFLGGTVNINADYPDGLGSYKTVTNTHNLHIAGGANNNTFDSINLEGKSQEYFIYSHDGSRNLFLNCRYELAIYTDPDLGRLYFDGTEFSKSEANVLFGGFDLEHLKIDGNSTGVSELQIFTPRRGWQLNSASAISPALSLRNRYGAAFPALDIYDQAIAGPSHNPPVDTNLWALRATAQSVSLRNTNDASPWFIAESWARQLRIAPYGVTNRITNIVDGEEEVTNRVTYFYHNVRVGYDTTNAFGQLHFESEANAAQSGLDGSLTPTYSYLVAGGYGVGASPTPQFPIYIYRSIDDELSMVVRNTSDATTGAGFRAIGPTSVDSHDVTLRYYGTNTYGTSPNWQDKGVIMTSTGSKGLVLQTTTTNAAIDISGGGWVPAISASNTWLYLPTLGGSEIYSGETNHLLVLEGTNRVGKMIWNGEHFTNGGGVLGLGLRTVWRDSMAPATRWTAGGTAPGTTSLLGSGNIKLLTWEATGDTIGSDSIQLNHDCKTNVITLRPHAHYHPTTVAGAASNIVWRLEYSWANYGEVANPIMTIQQTNAVGQQAWKHEIVSFGDITVTNWGVSPMFHFALTRLGSNASDNYAADVAMIGLDVHYPADSMGSKEELVK